MGFFLIYSFSSFVDHPLLAPPITEPGISSFTTCHCIISAIHTNFRRDWLSSKDAWRCLGEMKVHGSLIEMLGI